MAHSVTLKHIVFSPAALIAAGCLTLPSVARLAAADNNSNTQPDQKIYLGSTNRTYPQQYDKVLTSLQFVADTHQKLQAGITNNTLPRPSRAAKDVHTLLKLLDAMEVTRAQEYAHVALKNQDTDRLRFFRQFRNFSTGVIISSLIGIMGAYRAYLSAKQQGYYKKNLARAGIISLICGLTASICLSYSLLTLHNANHGWASMIFGASIGLYLYFKTSKFIL